MIQKTLNRIAKLKLLLFGYKVHSRFKNNQQSDKLSIVYNVHNSMPETNNGYAMRTDTIAHAVQKENISIKVVTRAAFPMDFNFLKEYHNDILMYEIGGIEYHRLKKDALHIGKVNDIAYINRYAYLLKKFSKNKNATIIHSASNYINGLAGVSAANSLGIPSIYEVRGFWEITRASREPAFKNSLAYKLQKKLEIQACTEATSVIALSEVVKEELINRGIEDEKIFVVPNGVDTDSLKPLPKESQTVETLKLKDKFVVGFIGSVVDYEGLSLLIQSAKAIEAVFPNMFRYLIVGDGNDLLNLQDLVKSLDIEHLFIFTGRVPYEEVENYYSVADIFCYPRLDWEVCRIVSPKKPFEAMAYGKPIVSSSVRANSYFIEHEINGLVHQKESVESIVENIIKLYEDKELYHSISQNAREWVVKYRDSKSTGKLLKKIYQHTQIIFYKGTHK